MASEEHKYTNPGREPLGGGEGQDLPDVEAKFSPASAPSPRPPGMGYGGGPPERQMSAPGDGEGSPYKRAPPPPERPFAEGPPSRESDYGPPYEGGEYHSRGRGGYGGGSRGGYEGAGGPPPPASGAGPEYDDEGYARGGYRGRGHYDRGGYGRGRGRGEYSDGPPTPSDGPPSESGDRPNISVYPPRDPSDAKPSFEVYPPREGSSGPPDRPAGPPEAAYEYAPPPSSEGYDRGRGYYRSPRGGRPPYYRGRGRGYDGYDGGDYGEGRGRGWVDRGRGGWVDRGRGDRGRGWVDRGRGMPDRGRGWIDRGRGGDRGRGWVDRGRGGWVDRGRGWVDRGRGGWVDRGRGGWVDRGRGWVDRGRGGYERGRGRGRGNIEFDKTGEYMWDEKNSCWKKVPQHWKEQMQQTPEKGQFEGAPREGGPPQWQRNDWDHGPPGGSEWGHPPAGRGGGPPRDEWGPPRESWQGGPPEAQPPVWEEDGWVWDEREQAWRTQRPDGSWEWEWEYEAREAAQAGRGGPERRNEKSHSASPSWRGDYKPQVDEAGRELPRAYAPVERPEESDSSSDSDTDSSSDSDLERHRAAEKALLKYKKASKKGRAFAEEIEKQRKKLLKVEEKLRKHKERKKKKKALKRSRAGYPVVGPDGRSPPRQYRGGGGAAEEGEVDEFSDNDGRDPREPSDIFHRPGLKYRDKGPTYGPDPGGGVSRDVDYRFPAAPSNAYGDQDERSREWIPQEAQAFQKPALRPQWRQPGDERGRHSAASSGSEAPFAQTVAQKGQEEWQETQARERELERQRFRRQPQQGVGQKSAWRESPREERASREGSFDEWRTPKSRQDSLPSVSGDTPRSENPEARDRESRSRSRDLPWKAPPEPTRRDSESFRAPSEAYSNAPSVADSGIGHPSESPWREPSRNSDYSRSETGSDYVPLDSAGGSRGSTGRRYDRDGSFSRESGYDDRQDNRGVKRKRQDEFDDPRRGNFCKGTPNTSAVGNNSDYREYADYFGLEDVAFREASLEPAWVRSTPADLYFRRDKNSNDMMSTNKMHDIEDYFEQNLVLRATAVRDEKPKYEKPTKNCPIILHSFSDSESGGSDDEEVEDEINKEMQEEIDRKIHHPERLHEELWFNEQGESNTGPYCRCSLKARRTGIRHSIYPGDVPYPVCDPASNNWDKLHHYRLSVSPVTNFLLKDPTLIHWDSHEYIFEGFSLFSHYRINNSVPQCKVVRFNIEYTLHWIEEDPPLNYDIRSIDLFNDYLMEEILELYDLNLRDDEGGCRKFHFMPRFARPLPDNGKEILSMDNVLSYLIKSAKPLITKEELATLVDHSPHQWADYVDTVRGSVITLPGMRPSSLRIDQLDREGLSHDNLVFPKIVHFGMKPSRITYVGNPEYNKLWKQFVKFRHLLTYKPKVTPEDRQKVKNKEEQLQNLRLKKSLKREVTVALESEGWLKTGFNADVCQHALMLPVLISHLRFHRCLDHLEEKLRYKFNNRQLLQYALTHPSYRYGTVNYGTNPDHARNSMFNCGMRCPEFGNKSDWIKVHRKRGINVLIKIMAKMAKKEEQASLIDNYERLEFLGDAVVEFITTVHLYFMLPDAPEGVLATYRSAIVQNQHLTELAKNLNLQDYFLFAHGPDLCHESEIRHALANCFEALMGALFMDSGIELADRIFGEAFFKGQPELLETWHKLPLHPLQEDEPNGDRHWIEKSPPLQKLLEFEEQTGIAFDHIRLLARAFTVRNVGYTTLTLGHNQRMEFLGDSVMQLVVSEYVFKYFPDHHEGHLSLLRQCLVNNKTQCLVCEDLAMEQYMITTAQRKRNDLAYMKTKEKADLIEAFIGALYVDKGLEWVRVFLRVCFFPRLKEFIMLGDWNDPKSRLQQCCLLRRDPNDQEPEMPKYKVLESKGPTNTRVYRVAVYFKGQRLADAEGSSIQQAEMKAAEAALNRKEELFPLLKYHKKFLNTKFKGLKSGEFTESELFEPKIPEDNIVPFKHEEKEDSEPLETKPNISVDPEKSVKSEPEEGFESTRSEAFTSQLQSDVKSERIDPETTEVHSGKSGDQSHVLDSESVKSDTICIKPISLDAE